tara:strand:+ start:340 stop:618 length:279 start_codon:yes stop_codon:yes gene_type:complete
MSKTVHKATAAPDLQNGLIGSFQVPIDALVLHAGVQDDFPVIWYLTDADAPPVGHRHIDLYMTGVTLPHVGTHHGTFILNNGLFVLHAFERI